MATGDIGGNIQQLLRELRTIKYPNAVDEVGVRLGDPVAFLPLLHFCLLQFSKHVALAIVNTGIQVGHGDTMHMPSRQVLTRLRAACRQDRSAYVPGSGVLGAAASRSQAHTHTGSLTGFVEYAFKLARDQFRIRTVITPCQFLEQASPV
jgi:hypothetical protein